MPDFPSKISTGFAARLERLKPGQRVRAIVLLRVSDGRARGRRQSEAERHAAVGEVHKEAASALPEIDRILANTQGRRLAGQPDALGAVPVETTADGIRALASSDLVQAILEDQPIVRAL